MSSQRDHATLAVRFDKTLQVLVGLPGDKDDGVVEWTATVAFYQALHLIEAVFAADGHHRGSHDDRLDLLKKEPRYQEAATEEEADEKSQDLEFGMEYSPSLGGGAFPLNRAMDIEVGEADWDNMTIDETI